MGLGVDVDLAEELISGAGGQVGLAGGGGLLEDHLGSERVVERVGAEGARVERAGDELPERLEVLELGA